MYNTIDWNRFFSTYVPNIPKKNSLASVVSVDPSLLNPYSDLALNTFLITDDVLFLKPSSIFDSLNWESSTKDTSLEKTENNSPDDLKDDFTIESYRQKNNLGIGDYSLKSSDAFVFTFAPIIEKYVRKYNSDHNLGMSEELILKTTKRITLHNSEESGYGTSSVANSTNNTGGVKFTNWLAAEGGSPKTYAPNKNGDNGRYSGFNGVKQFFNALFKLYEKRYNEIFFAKSDYEFIDILKRRGYFQETAQKVYNTVFNSFRKNSWEKYINSR